MALHCRRNTIVGIGGPSAPHVFALDRIEDLGALGFSLHTLLLVCCATVMLYWFVTNKIKHYLNVFSAMFVVKICGYLSILFAGRCAT